MRSQPRHQNLGSHVPAQGGRITHTRRNETVTILLKALESTFTDSANGCRTKAVDEDHDSATTHSEKILWLGIERTRVDWYTPPRSAGRADGAPGGQERFAVEFPSGLRRLETSYLARDEIEGRPVKRQKNPSVHSWNFQFECIRSDQGPYERCIDSEERSRNITPRSCYASD
jgi:hypothetical protein